MRALLVVGSLALLTACSTVRSSVVVPTPSALPVSSAPSDVSGRWTGTWIGTGLFDSPREEEVILDLKQVGRVGYGRVIFDGSVAAESVPWGVRREGLAGARVSARIKGSKVELMHERGRSLFAADLTRISEDRMIGDVSGSAPGVRLLLTRVRRPDASQAAAVTPQATPTTKEDARVKEEPPAKIEDAPVAELPPATETPVDRDPVQIAAVIPSEEPQAPVERPRLDEFVPATDLKVIYFDFDSANLKTDARDALTSTADWLKQHEDLQVMIEGHCDEAGTPEYNQVLGQQRAQSVKSTLAAAGVEAERMATISYGKERPVCTDINEACRSLNRHVEFRIKSR
jgi:peptidoglycan-associated lipoprotein